MAVEGAVDDTGVLGSVAKAKNDGGVMGGGLDVEGMEAGSNRLIGGEVEGSLAAYTLPGILWGGAEQPPLAMQCVLQRRVVHSRRMRVWLHPMTRHFVFLASAGNEGVEKAVVGSAGGVPG